MKILKTKYKEFRFKKELLKLLKSDLQKVKFPKIVVLQSLNRCNCACSMCPYPFTIAKEEKTMMSEKLYKNILNQLKNQPEFESLIFAFQNEPLLDKRIIKFAKIFKQEMPNKKLELVTNGSLLLPDKKESIYKYFDLVHVSLNAFSQKTHKIVSNSDYYKRILKNLINISKTKRHLEKTIIRFINQKSNTHEKKQFYQFWRSKGFMVFGFDVNNRLQKVKKFKNKIKLGNNLGRIIKMKILKYSGKLILPTCPIPFLCIYIKANGDIVQCFNDWSNKHILGNLNNQSIKSIFNNKKYTIIRKQLIQDKLDENVICSKCDLYKDGVWLTV